jgi:hypothetical protein
MRHETTRHGSFTGDAGRVRGPARAFAVAASLAVVLSLPATVSAYRRGLGSSIGGSTLDRGHVIWIAGGYPSLGLGWGMAVHPLVDLMVHAELLYGSPNEVDDTIVGGGGGVRARVALLRGRTSAAVTVDLAADAYGEGGGAAALLDLVSPGAELSFRLSPAIAIHTRIQVALAYATQPNTFFGGFEVGAGVTVGLTSHLAFFGTASTGATLSTSSGHGAVRLEALVGLEYRLGHR